MKRLRRFLYVCGLLTSLLGYSQSVFDYNHEGLNLVYRVTDEDMHTCKVLYVPAAFPLNSENDEFTAHSYSIPSTVRNYDQVEYTVTEIEEEAFKDYDQSRILYIPSSITTIGSRAFNDSRIESIIIDAEVEELPSQMFAGCDVLRCIIINASEPPKISNDTFPDAVLANSVLKLPSGIRTLYEEDELWSRFECMKSSSGTVSSESNTSLYFTTSGLPTSTSSSGLRVSISTESPSRKDMEK